MKLKLLLGIDHVGFRVRVPQALLTLGLFCLLAQPGLAATLTHRYSFNTGAGDSVGGANGVLLGNAYVTNGALVLDGTNSCVQLPDNLFTNYNSISFEIWYADEVGSGPSNQLYNFSGPQGGMTYYLFGQGLQTVGSTVDAVNLGAPAVGGTNHVTWVEDAASHTASIYVNGLLAAENTHFTNTPAMIGSTTTNCLGAETTNQVSTRFMNSTDFKGRILEFRAYQGALTPREVAMLDAFGPNNPQTNPGTLEALRLDIPSTTGPGALFRPNVFADFSGITNVNVSTQPDLILTSDNTNVIQIASDHRVQTLALGTANITAAWEGVSNTVAVTVAVPQDIELMHRYSFNEATNDWIVRDSVSGANGRLVSSYEYPAIVSPPLNTYLNAYFTGTGEMEFREGGIIPVMRPYAALPPDLISSLSEVTIEAWVTWTGTFIGPWQRIFDFGSNSGGVGVSYLFLTPQSGFIISSTGNYLMDTAISTNGNYNENPRLLWTNTCPTNVLTQVAVAYSPVRGVMKMYLNGQPIAAGTATIPLSAIVDTNCWLGKSQFSSDPYFQGSYDEFRIYRGLLSDADVAADYAAGPNVIGVDYELHDYLSSNSLAITWGPSATNWFLESSPTLGSNAVWTPVSGTPRLLNGRYRVTVPISGEASYFRLHAPP